MVMVMVERQNGVPAKEILGFIVKTPNVAQIGLAYSKDAFDIDRSRQHRWPGAELLSKPEDIEAEKVAEWIAYDGNCATPKPDVGARA